MTKSLHGHYKSQGNEHLKRWVAMSPPGGLSTERHLPATSIQR